MTAKYQNIGTLFLRAYAVYEGQGLVTAILLTFALVSNRFVIILNYILMINHDQSSIAGTSYVTVTYINASSSKVFNCVSSQ